MKTVFMLTLGNMDNSSVAKPTGNTYIIDSENSSGFVTDREKCKTFIDDLGGIERFRRFVRYCEDILHDMTIVYDNETRKNMLEEAEIIVKDEMKTDIQKAKYERNMARIERSDAMEKLEQAQNELKSAKKMKLEAKVARDRCMSKSIYFERREREVARLKDELEEKLYKLDSLQEDLIKQINLGCITIYEPSKKDLFKSRTLTDEILSMGNISTDVANFILKINIPTFERETDNFDESTFDFIRIFFSIKQYIGESRSIFIKKHINEFNAIATHAILNSNTFYKFNTHIDQLKISEMCITEQNELMMLYEKE